MFNFDVGLLLIVFGSAFIIAWLMGLFWNWRSWYWRSQRAIYGYLPIGLLFFLANWEVQLQNIPFLNIWVLRGLYLLLISVAIWLTVRPPEFIKPKWIQQIEREPKWVYKEMVNQINKGYDWKKRFVDNNSLESWIKEIKRKRPKK